MIGVNNLNAPPRTLVRRQSVEYDDAEEIFERLISGRSGTVDPAIYPDGEIYEFDDNGDLTGSRRFYEDNSPNNEKPIYLIGITKNCKESLVFANRVAYDGLKNNDKNPLFGRWYAEGEEWNDTCYVEVTIDHAKALELKSELDQDKILVIRNNGRWEEI